MKTVAPAQPRAIVPPEALLLPPLGARIAGGTGTEGDLPRMLIGLAQLQRVVSRMHALPGEQDDSVLYRIRYLVKTGFPRRFDTVRGGRTAMGVEDALRVVLAFELFALGPSNAFATDAVNANWRVLAPALAAAWPGLGDDRDDGSAGLLLVRGEALLRDGDQATGPSYTFSPMTAVDLADALTAVLKRGPAAVIDVGSLLTRFADAVRLELVATAETLDHEMRLFAADVFGTENTAIWRVEAVSPVAEPA